MEDLKFKFVGSLEFVDPGSRTSNAFHGFNQDSFTMDIFNMTDKVLKIKNRFGLTRTVYPKINSIKRVDHGVGIRITMIISKEDIEDSARSLYDAQTKSYISGAFYKELEQQLGHLKKKKVPVPDYLCLEINILISSLKVNDCFSYFSELDLTLGLFDAHVDARKVPHPSTPDKINRYDSTADYYHDLMLKAHSNPLNIALHYVDNSGHKTFSDKYMSICGEVYKIPIIYDPQSTHHGFVLSRSHTPVAESHFSPNGRDVFLSPVDASNILGVSNNVEDAIFAGDGKIKHERQLVEAKREIEVLRIENERIKLESDKIKVSNDRDKEKFNKIKLFRDQIMADLKHRQDLFEMQYKLKELKAKKIVPYTTFASNILSTMKDSMKVINTLYA